MLLKRYRSNRLICGIDGTPFTVVMLVFVVTLLVIGMAVPQPHHNSSVDLPKVYHATLMPQVDKEGALIVAITRNGRIFFGSSPAKHSDLAEMIRASVNRGAEPKVYIRADARAKYIWVKEVVDGVQASGVEKIGFLVDQRKTPAQSLQAIQ